jgi:hypothetical protein
MIKQFDLNFDIQDVADYAVDQSKVLGRPMDIIEFRSMFDTIIQQCGIDNEKQLILNELVKNQHIDAQKLLMDLEIQKSNRSNDTFMTLKSIGIISKDNKNKNGICKYVERGETYQNIKYRKNTFLLTYLGAFKVLTNIYGDNTYAKYFAIKYQMDLAFTMMEEEFNEYLMDINSQDYDSYLHDVCESNKQRNKKIAEYNTEFNDMINLIQTNKDIKIMLKNEYYEQDDEFNELEPKYKDRLDYKYDLEQKEKDIEDKISDFELEIQQFDDIPDNIMNLFDYDDIEIGDVEDVESDTDIRDEFSDNEDYYEFT